MIHLKANNTSQQIQDVQGILILHTKLLKSTLYVRQYNWILQPSAGYSESGPLATIHVSHELNSTLICIKPSCLRLQVMAFIHLFGCKVINNCSQNLLYINGKRKGIFFTDKQLDFTYLFCVTWFYHTLYRKYRPDSVWIESIALKSFYKIVL